MRISSFFYSLRQGFKNIRRNKLFSLASISTIAACVFLIGIFYSIVVNFQYMIEKAESTISITVFFDEDLDETQIQAVGDEIKKRVEVSDIVYTSGEQAWENFKESYFTEENMDLAAGFEEDNPLAKSASYEIFLNDVTMHESLVEYLNGLDGIRRVNAADSAASTISDFGKLVGYVSAAIIIVLFAVGVFLISNTVMIGITVRKEEIGIMKLIGATDYFVRAPFIVEGITIGLLGAAIPLVAIYFIYREVVTYVLSQFQTLTSYVSFLPVSQIFQVLIPMALFIGAGIGFLGSMVSIRKHLRV